MRTNKEGLFNAIEELALLKALEFHIKTPKEKLILNRIYARITQTENQTN